MENVRFFGTYRVPKDKTKTMTLAALRLGYRGIDCAELYRNEKFVMEAVLEFLDERKDVTRDDLFITTKIRKFSPEDVNERVSIFKKIDCLLIHFPTTEYVETWKALNEYVKNNNLNIKHLGVSNFKTEHLEAISSLPYSIYCNQIEITPFWKRNDIVLYCKKNNIKITSHSPLVKGEKKDNSVLQRLSVKYNCSWANILLAFCFQQNYIPLPRSCNEEHLKENLTIPTLDWIDIQSLENLDEQFATHPQYK